jgi:serine/threonine-protein kinase
MANYRYFEPPIAIGGEKAVYKGICVENGIDVVVKFLKTPYSQQDRTRFAHEVDRMRLANQTAGASVAKIIDHNLQFEPPFYVEEYFPDGTLAKKMQGIFANGQVFVEGAAVGYCRQILRALAGIHAGNQIHRDLKPANIMVREKQMVINDMGIGRTMDRPTTLQTRAFCGTKGYAAPEQELHTGVDQRCDLYAVGVILHEMLTKVRGQWNAITYSANPQVVVLLNRLLAFDRNRRFATAAAAADYITALGIATR